MRLADCAAAVQEPQHIEKPTAQRQGEIMNTKKILGLIFVLPLMACASSGVKVDQAKLNEFTVGKSTCADVQAALGKPNLIKPSDKVEGDTVWGYVYTAKQAHPENFIPMVGAFVKGFDTEQTVTGFRFNAKCVLDKTYYAEASEGAGGNLEGVAQERKDTRSTDDE